MGPACFFSAGGMGNVFLGVPAKRGGAFKGLSVPRRKCCWILALSALFCVFLCVCVKLVLLLTVAAVVVVVGFQQFFSSTAKISVDPLRRCVFYSQCANLLLPPTVVDAIGGFQLSFAPWRRIQDIFSHAPFVCLIMCQPSPPSCCSCPSHSLKLSFSCPSVCSSCSCPLMTDARTNTVLFVCLTCL